MKMNDGFELIMKYFLSVPPLKFHIKHRNHKNSRHLIIKKC